MVAWTDAPPKMDLEGTKRSGQVWYGQTVKLFQVTPDPQQEGQQLKRYETKGYVWFSTKDFLTMTRLCAKSVGRAEAIKKAGKKRITKGRILPVNG